MYYVESLYQYIQHNTHIKRLWPVLFPTIPENIRIYAGERKKAAINEQIMYKRT